MVKIHLRRERSFCFAGSVPIGAKGSCGWEQDSCFYINALKQDGYPRNIQEAADLTEEQYKYLMMGLNPLDPKIKDVDPKNIY